MDGNLGLSSMSLNVSQICNMKCSYCWANEGSYNNKGLMDLNVAKKSINLLKTFSTSDCSVTLFGGEPLLNFDVIKNIIPYAIDIFGERKIRFTIITNGTILNDEIIQIIKDYSILMKISIDGDIQHHDKNRTFKDGSPTYQKIITNVNKLKSAGISPEIRATLCHQNTNIKEFFDYFINNLNLTADVTPVRSIDKNIMFDKDDLAELYKNYLDIYKQLLDDGNLKCFLNNEMLNRMVVRCCDESEMLSQNKTWGCDAGRGLIAIDIEGDIYPCPSFIGHEKFIMGNIDDINFQKLRNFARSTHISNKNKCLSCDIKNICGGGCLHHNYTMSGDVAIPDEIQCEFNKSMYALGTMFYNYMKENELPAALVRDSALARSPELIELYRILKK
jgi:uncharacterized protein